MTSSAARGPEHDTTTPPLTDEMVIAGVSAYCDRMATGATIGQCVQAALRAALATTAAPVHFGLTRATCTLTANGDMVLTARLSTATCLDCLRTLAGRATTADTDPPRGMTPQALRNIAQSAEKWVPMSGGQVGLLRRWADELERRASGDRPASPGVASHPDVAGQVETVADGDRPAEPERRHHRPFTDDGVTYCGWDGKDGCGEVWPCSTVRAAAGAAGVQPEPDDDTTPLPTVRCGDCGTAVDLPELAQRFIRREARAARRVSGVPDPETTP